MLLYRSLLINSACSDSELRLVFARPKYPEDLTSRPEAREFHLDLYYSDVK